MYITIIISPMLASLLKTRSLARLRFSFTENLKEVGVEDRGEPSFLEMVEAFFDKAANHTDISKDKLDFYKKSESLVKLHLALKRGNPTLI